VREELLGRVRSDKVIQRLPELHHRTAILVALVLADLQGRDTTGDEPHRARVGCARADLEFDDFPFLDVGIERLIIEVQVIGANYMDARVISRWQRKSKPEAMGWAGLLLSKICAGVGQG
jgi:hypothetical protein